MKGIKGWNSRSRPRQKGGIGLFKLLGLGLLLLFVQTLLAVIFRSLFTSG
jgi:hypothetical protein